MSSLPALFGVLVFTFLLMRVLPGDPAVFFASGPNAGKEEIEVIRKQMGLDKPVPDTIGAAISTMSAAAISAARMMTGQSVTKDLRDRLPASLELTFTRAADRAGVGDAARRAGGAEAGLARSTMACGCSARWGSACRPSFRGCC